MRRLWLTPSRVASLSSLTPLPQRSRRSPTRAVGIVTNEFFDAALGRMGGFGWAARVSAECLNDGPGARYRPVLLAGRGGLGRQRPERHESGILLVRHDDDQRRYRSKLDGARVGLFLTIDYRPNYRPVLETRDLPTLVWVRDPRTPSDNELIATLELPTGGDPPQGIASIDCHSLAAYVDHALTTGARVAFASPAPGLAIPRMRATYGVEPDDMCFLPNPIRPFDTAAPETDRPRVAFLGRLDPIKRPWVVVELARRMPHVEFLLLGQTHFTGPGSWSPTRLPENVFLLGHIDGERKRSLLASSWLLINSSIHESLPISFLEALHVGTPIVSCQDPEGVTSRFGRYVGRFGGNGLDALDAFAIAVERLVDDRELRRRLGDAGREWARANHTPERFVATFTTLADSLGG